MPNFSKNSSPKKFALINAKFLCIVLLNAVFYALWRSGLNAEFSADFSAFKTFADFANSPDFKALRNFGLYFFRNFLWNFSAFFVLLFLCALVGRAFYRLVLNAAFWASLLIVGVNLCLLINFHAVLDPVALQIFLATNTREAGEFIAMYANFPTLLALLALAFVAFLAHFVKFSLNFTKRFCAAAALACLAFTLPNALTTSLQNSLDKTQLVKTAQIFTKGYAEQQKFIQAYKELDEKMSTMLAARLESVQTRERERV